MSEDITTNVPPKAPPLRENEPPVVPVADGDTSSRALTQDEKSWGMYVHLAALAGLAFPGVGNLVGPLIVWMIKKDEMPFVDRHGKEEVNFQINILILYLLTLPIVLITFGIAFFLPMAVGILGAVMPIIAGMKANNGEEYQYPYIVRLIK